MRELSGRIKELEARAGARSRTSATRLAAALPNLPDPEAPDGMTEEDAVVLREVGERPQFDFEPRDHLEIGTELGLIDIEAAASASGSRFAYLQGDLVLVELALVRFAIELLRAEGHEPVVPPVLVREEALFGTGFLPGDRDQIYEMPERRPLPRRHLGGLAGRPARRPDPRAGRAAAPLRGLLDLLPPRGRGRRARTRAGSSASTSSTRWRCSRSSSPRTSAPSTSACWRSRSGSCSELEIPYRVVDIAVGDLGASAARKYDCEAWIPSQDRYRELTSCSNTTDFQARRLSCRYRPAERRITPARAHAQRDGRRRGTHPDRPDREPPGAGRQFHATQFSA